MSKAIEDLTKIRFAFDSFERAMFADTEKAVSKHGLAKTSDVLAKVAQVRDALHALHTAMEK